MTPFWTIVIPCLAGFITIFFTWLLNRKLNKAQTEGVVVDQFDKLVEKLFKQIEANEKRMEGNEAEIAMLKKNERRYTGEIERIKQDNEECKYLHEVHDLELKQIKKQTDYHSIKKELVYVLDDDPDIITDFQRKFSKLSVLDFEGFHDVDRFMKKAKVHRPQIIVLDYLLNRGLTAEDVINDIGYEPEVFIMSGEKRFANNFEIDRVRFFEKDDNFIMKIVIAIIRYLINKS